MFLALVYVWNVGFALASDTPPPADRLPMVEFNESAYQDVKKGDVVWVKSGYLRHFYENVFPKIQEPFFLIVNDGDESFPTQQATFFDVDKLITSDKVLHIFAQNYSLKEAHPKISGFPIGIDFHTLTSSPEMWKEAKASPELQEDKLEQLLLTLKPTSQRKTRIYADFQHNDSLGNGAFKRYLEVGETRKSIFKTICATGLVDYTKKKVPRIQLWAKRGEYAFTVSPPGNGLDCHRTWEDLTLGCIVIVKTSSLDPIYEGLPVVIVKDWSEITKANLKKWQKQYGDAFHNPSYRYRLTHAYWMDKINKMKETL